MPDFGEREVDVIYEAKVGGRKVYFYLLIELQRKVDYRMGFRLMVYIVQILLDYYKNADEKARKRKNFKFPVVFPIVFFNGSGRWTVPLNVREMFADYKRFGEYVIGFNYALVDAKGYDDESVKGFQSKLLSVMMLFERSGSFADLLETAQKHSKEIAKLKEEEKNIVNIAFKILSEAYGQEQGEKLTEILKAQSAERVKGMLSDVIDNAKRYEMSLIKQGRQEGRKEGRKEGEQKGEQKRNMHLIQKMARRGDSVDEIADFLEIPIEEVMEVLSKK